MALQVTFEKMNLFREWLALSFLFAANILVVAYAVHTFITWDFHIYDWLAPRIFIAATVCLSAAAAFLCVRKIEKNLLVSSKLASDVAAEIRHRPSIIEILEHDNPVLNEKIVDTFATEIIQRLYKKGYLNAVSEQTKKAETRRGQTGASSS